MLNPTSLFEGDLTECVAFAFAYELHSRQPHQDRDPLLQRMRIDEVTALVIDPRDHGSCVEFITDFATDTKATLLRDLEYTLTEDALENQRGTVGIAKMFPGALPVLVLTLDTPRPA